jgi:hypothetical protein
MMEKKWKERVKLLKKTLKQRDDGEVDIFYEDITTVWGHLKPIKPKLMMEDSWKKEPFSYSKRNEQLFALFLKPTSLRFEAIACRDKLYAVVGPPYNNEDNLTMCCWVKLKEGEKRWAQTLD